MGAVCEAFGPLQVHFSVAEPVSATKLGATTSSDMIAEKKQHCFVFFLRKSATKRIGILFLSFANPSDHLIFGSGVIACASAARA
jgi:hypothetical protein